MIQLFYTANDTFREEERELSVAVSLKDKWVHLTNPTDREIELVERMTGVGQDMLKAALDEEERARIEADEDDGHTLVLFDIPTIEEESTYYSYSTMPLGVILTGNTLISVCLKENSVVHSILNGRGKATSTAKRERLLYQLMYNTHVKFLQYLRQIDKSSQRLQAELKRTTKNKELIQLLDLENSLIYFSTSLRSNSIVIEKINRMPKWHVQEEDEELLEDVGIENRQALDMCNIYRDILDSTMNAYSSVISNNMNLIMRSLTALTVVLAIPTLISGLWGMNTGVPFEGKQWGFWVVVVFSAIVTGISTYFLMRGKALALTQDDKKKKNKNKTKKK